MKKTQVIALLFVAFFVITCCSASFAYDIANDCAKEREASEEASATYQNSPFCNSRSPSYNWGICLQLATNAQEFIEELGRCIKYMITGITINERNKVFQVGDSFQYTAKIEATYVTKENNTVKWECDDTSIGTIDQTGLFIARSAGVAIIKAIAKNGQSDETLVSVGGDVPVVSGDVPVVSGDVPKNIDFGEKPTVYSNISGAAGAISSSDITSTDLEVSGNATFIKEETAILIIGKYLETNETLVSIEPLPVFSKNIVASKDTAAVAWQLKGIQLLADNFEDVQIHKITSSTNAFKFDYVASADLLSDGKFTILSTDGATVSGALDNDTTYQLILAIKDNGSYDLNATVGTVSDPAVIVKTKASGDETSPTPPSGGGGGGGGGGCSAGYGALALLAVAPLIIRRKK